MRRRKLRSIIGGLLALTCAVSAWLVFHEGGLHKGHISKVIASNEEPFIEKPEAGQPDMAGPKSRQDPLIDIARERYNETIADIKTQISFIEELVAYLSKKYPDDWPERIAAFIQEVFPDYAEEILIRLNKLQAYNTWLADNNTWIMSMSRKERNRILWEKREEIFGSDAMDIWVSDLRNDRIHDAIDLISTSRDTVLEEKLDIYLDTIYEIYGDNTGRFLDERGFELVSAFLEIDAVQDDLRRMGPQERGQGIYDIREAIGIDEGAIKRLEALDVVRDKRWETGAQYMLAREEIVLICEGLEQKQRIDELRKQYFGSKAETIKAEEDSGFFRFARKRIYGMN